MKSQTALKVAKPAASGKAARTHAAPAPTPAPRPVAAPAAPVATIAKANWAAAVSGAKFVDLAMIASGVAAAAGSVVFAGYMVMQGDHSPDVNGLQYLAVFGQPSRAPQRPPIQPTEVAAAPAPKPSIDMAPLGAIGAAAEPSPPLPPVVAPNLPPTRGEYMLIGAQAERAWVRAGPRILAVRPGDDLPNLGKVKSIVWRSGHWALIDEDGSELLKSGESAGPNAKGTPFAKPMIFGDGGQ